MIKKILTLFDLSKSEIENLIDRSLDVFLEIRSRNFKPKRRIDGKVCLMYFEKPSTRTRISFESAIEKLGGRVIFVSPNETQLSRGEDKSDFAKVFAGYVDFTVARVHNHETLEIFYKNTNIPTINALSDLSHPTQVISDLATIKLILGDYKNKKICFMGDAQNNVARSWMEAYNVLGDFELILSAPQDFLPDEDYQKITDPIKAIEKSDIIYLDVWFSMGQDFDEQKYKKLLPYSLDESKINLLSGKIVMHCLPAKKGEEISHKVFSLYENIIFTQAHMKMPCAISIVENLDI